MSPFDIWCKSRYCQSNNFKRNPLTPENIDNAFNENIHFENVGKLNPIKVKVLNDFLWVTIEKMEALGHKMYGFFPLVFCENRNIELLKTVFEREFYPDKLHEHQQFLRSLVQNTEEKPRLKIKILSQMWTLDLLHHSGCGGTRSDSKILGKLLSGYVNNPNVVGATVLSLGCQNLQVELFLETQINESRF